MKLDRFEGTEALFQPEIAQQPKTRETATKKIDPHRRSTRRDRQANALRLGESIATGFSITTPRAEVDTAWK